jgi:hypothetical protein
LYKQAKEKEVLKISDKIIMKIIIIIITITIYACFKNGRWYIFRSIIIYMRIYFQLTAPVHIKMLTLLLLLPLALQPTVGFGL